MLINNTPVEKYQIGDRQIHVKREDLCTQPPGPTFSKVRGLWRHLETLKAKGCKVVGYTETSISMAGWGVAWMAPMFDMKAVIFDPQYAPRKKLPRHLRLLDFHREQWAKHKATIEKIPAGRARVNYHFCRKRLAEKYANSTMLPLGLVLPEAVEETALEAQRTKGKWGSVVVNVGSGTVCAGLLRHFHSLDNSPRIYGILGRTGDMKRKSKQIVKKAAIREAGLFGKEPKLTLVDGDYQYTDFANGSAPFPCHDFYDLKAWVWLERLPEAEIILEEPILFWNIGSQRREKNGTKTRRN